MDIRVQEAPFDAGEELNRFTSGCSGSGAIVSFSGIVRPDDGLTALEIEHYPQMSEAAISKIADEARKRWGLVDLLVIHRHGRLDVGEAIMMVVTAAPHRQAAFESADFLMDYLKSRAPFWKKEHFDGDSRWVAARHSDEAALDRWQD